MRITRLALAVLSLLGAAPEVTLVPTEISLVSEGQADGAVVAAVAEARGVGDSSARVESLAAVPGKAVLNLLPGISWTISVQVKGLWAPDVRVVPVGRGEPVILRLRRTGTVRGSLLPPRGEISTGPVAIRFESSTDAHGVDPIPRSSRECAVHEGEFRCELPQGRLDLRLKARGYMPQYRWAIDIQPGRVLSLGAFPLLRGSSLAGRVQTANGLPIDRTCTVALSPSLIRSPPAGTRQGGELSRQTTVAGNGFFQFDHVAAGSYSLTARQQGFSKTVLAPVIVEKDRDVEISRPLTLTPPLRLVVNLDPPLDPWGIPWRAVLRMKDPELDSLRDVAAGKAVNGQFAKPGLDPGRYHLDIVDSQGASFLEEAFDLDADRTLDRRIDLVWIEGSVTLGDQPLATRLQFIGAGSRSTSIQFASDGKGRFSGVLPREGTWRIELPDLHRTLRHVAVHRAAGARAAKVRIEVPDNRIAGDVVDEGSNPVANAAVTANDLGTGDSQTAVTDERGSFELVGLPDAPHLVSAEAELAGRHLASEEVKVTLGKEHKREMVRLTLRDRVAIEGIVSSPTGPVPGAQIIAIPQAPASTLLSDGSTDMAGHFHLSVPPAAGGLQLLVMPPGFSFRSLRWSAPFPKPISIDVDDRGGSLILEAPALDLTDPTAPKPLVVEDGQAVPLSFLLTWARIAGQGSQKPSRLVIPRVSAGDYSACMLTQQEQIQVLLGLAALSGKSCDHGTLAPHGELILNVGAPPRL